MKAYQVVICSKTWTCASYNKIAGEIEVIKSQIVMEKALDGLQFDKEIFRVGKIRSV
ncbi:MAG: hypothetical protein ACI9UR_002105, partial [Bacteroidia bacterium]